MLVPRPPEGDESYDHFVEVVCRVAFAKYLCLAPHLGFAARLDALLRNLLGIEPPGMLDTPLPPPRCSSNPRLQIRVPICHYMPASLPLKPTTRPPPQISLPNPPLPLSRARAAPPPRLTTDAEHTLILGSYVAAPPKLDVRQAEPLPIMLRGGDPAVEEAAGFGSSDAAAVQRLWESCWEEADLSTVRFLPPLHRLPSRASSPPADAHAPSPSIPSSLLAAGPRLAAVGAGRLLAAAALLRVGAGADVRALLPLPHALVRLRPTRQQPRPRGVDVPRHRLQRTPRRL